MSNKKATKRALLTSILAICLCLVMLIGSTFAWFTDTASTGVNTIQSGTLKLALDMEVGEENGIIQWDNAEGKTLEFKKAAGAAADEKVLWEPGCTYELPALRIRNDGNLALKYKIAITGVTGNAKLLEAINFTVKVDGTQLVPNTTTTTGEGEGEDGGDISLTADPAPAVPAESDPTVADLNNFEGVLLVGEATGAITISGTMRTDAGNEYQGLSIDGIAITVTATQKDHEYDSDGNDYDKDAEYDKNAILGAVANYTLAEFNALTAIPEGVKTVYLDIGDVSLADGGVTIGNKSMADVYTSVTGDYSVGQELDDGRVVSSVWNASNSTYLANSNKAGITLYVSGSVNNNPEGGLNQSNSHSIGFVIPDASNIVFTKDFTVNGYFRCYFSWNDSQKLGGGVAAHKVQSVLFDHSTFNGIWIQNGGFNADSLTLDGCTFNAYENKVSANDSNPLWFCNIRTCDVTVKNCTFKASRPIKVVEQTVNGANVTITGNQFDMSLTNSANEASKPKNDAIMFCAITNTSTLGNVVVSGNEVTGGVALLTFFNPSQITMAEDATFTVSNNTLNNALLSVEWKTTTEYKPDFLK